VAHLPRQGAAKTRMNRRGDTRVLPQAVRNDNDRRELPSTTTAAPLRVTATDGRVAELAGVHRGGRDWVVGQREAGGRHVHGTQSQCNSVRGHWRGWWA